MQNPRTAKFCGGCGSALVRRCDNCGFEIVDGHAFCNECGSPVGAASGAQPIDEAVRKTVTVLFADLVGSTSFGESVDAESARLAMARYHEMARRVVERHGGHLEKFIGDGVMAVFGIPEIAEDDALRAVRCGLDLQAEFTTVKEYFKSSWDADVALRVGINTGEVVIAEDDADLIGDVLNTAARLEAACTPGEVLVGEETWRLTRSSVAYEVLNEIDVKGKALPVACFRVIRATDGGADFHTPFVGRERELDQLTVGFDAASAAGRARLVTVVGSPGVGKTRLAAELRERTNDYSRTFDLRVDPSGNATFAPMADLLRVAADLDEATEPAATTDAIRSFLGAEPEPRLVDALASLAGAQPPRSTEETFWACRRLIEEIGRDDSVVLVIDDIQWAEPLFLDLLEHLVEWVEAPALLVCLARPEIREIRPVLAEQGRRVSDVISIEGLDPVGTVSLAAHILDTDVLPPELHELIPATTEGNPLFVRELVRMLVDDGVIEEVDRAWRMVIDADAVEVPPTVQSLLASRVERMPSDERHFLEMASIVGSEFARGAVEALLPEMQPGELDRLIERLRRKELVDSTGGYWGDEPLLRFHHVLIRDAAYRRLLKERRAELHLAVAAWTERVAQRFAGDHELAIAYHLEQAHQYLSDLGSLDDAAHEIGAKAAGLLTVAAERALVQDDLAAAGSLANRALERLPEDHATRAEVLLLGCEAHLAASDVVGAEPLLAEMVGIASGDQRLSAWSDAFEGELVVLRSPDRLVDAEISVAAAAATLEALNDQAGVAKSRFVRALILRSLGRVAECESELDLALSAARAADDRRRITAVLGAAPLAALWGPSPVARAGGRCLDIIRLLRITTASPMVEATSIRCQGVLEAMRGRHEQARDLIGRSRDMTVELGLQQGILETAEFAGLVELFAADPAAAENHLREAYDGFHRMGASASAGRTGALLARSLLQQGRLEEAAQFANDSDALAGQALQTAIGSRGVLAEVAARAGRWKEAIEMAQQAVGLAAGTDLHVDHAVAAASLTAVYRAIGDEAAAANADADAVRLFEAKGAATSRRQAPGGSVARPSGEPAEGELHNRATANMAAFMEQLVADPKGLAERLDPDFVLVEHREHRTITRDDFAAVAESDAALRGEADRLVASPLAVRGDDLVLASTRPASHAAGFGGTSVSVGRMSADGAPLSIEMFHADQVQRAQRRLDELYVEDLPDGVREAMQIASRFRDAMADWSEPDLESILADDFAAAYHTDLGASTTLDRAAWLRNWAQGADLRGAATILWPRILRSSARGVLAEWTIEGERGDEWRFVALVMVREGKVSRGESFAANDVESAIRRFDQLSGTATATSAPNSRSALSAIVALLEDIGAGSATSTAASRCSVDVHLTDRRGEARELELKQFIALMNELPTAPIGPYGQWGEVAVAVRIGGIGQAFLVTGAVNADGLLTSVSILDGDAWVEASHIAGDHFRSTLPEAERAVADLITSLVVVGSVERDRDALLELLTDDFRSVYVDGFGRDAAMSAAEFADYTVEYGAGETYINLPSRVLRLNREGICLSRTVVVPDEAGTQQWAYVDLFLVRDGRFHYREQFAGDREADAEARFDELTSTGSAATRGIDNEASRALRSLMIAVAGRDQMAIDRLTAENFVRDDRRPTIGVAWSKQQLIDDAGTGSVVVASAGGTTTVLGLRGERLALVSSRRPADQDFAPGGLYLCEIDEAGLCSAVVVFEYTDLSAAVGEMMERFAAHVEPDEAEVIRTVNRFSRAFETGDRDSMDPEVADEFVYIDHRQVNQAFSTNDRDAFLDGAVNIVALGGHGTMYWPRVVAHNAMGVLGHATEAWQRPDGFESGDETIVLQVVDGGRIHRTEVFAEGDMAHARERFDLLTGGTPARHENRGARLQRLAMGRICQGRLDEAFAERGFVTRWSDRRELVGIPEISTESVHASTQALLEMGADFWVEPFEYVGDYAFLAHQGVRQDGSDTQFLVVARQTASGQATEFHFYPPDDLETARAKLNELGGGGLPSWANRAARIADVAFWRLVRGDGEGFRSLMAEDTVGQDERTTAARLPTGSIEEMVESIEALAAAGEKFRFVHVASRGERWALIHMLCEVGEVLTSSYGVVEVENDMVSQIIHFDGGPDGHKAAMDRMTQAWLASEGAPYRDVDTIAHEMARTAESGEPFEAVTDDFAVIDRVELAMANAGPGPLWMGDARLENLATRWCREAFGHTALRERDLDRYFELVAEHAEYVVTSNATDTDSGLIRMDRSQMEEWMRATVASDDDLSQEVEVLAVRGEHLALVSSSIRRSSAFGSGRGVQVLEVDPRGRLVYGRHWRSDELAKALGELEERFQAGLPPEAAQASRAGQAFDRAYTTRDEAALREVLAPGFESLDRRAVGFVRRNLDEMIERMHSRESVGSARATEITRSVLRCTAEGLVSIWEASDDAGTTWSYAVLVLVSDGRITYEEYFDASDLEAALDRFDSMTTAPASTFPQNEAARVSCQVWDSVRTTDAESFARLLAPDLRWNDGRSLVHVPGAADVLRGLFTDIELGRESLEADLAVRGETLSLQEVTIGNGSGNVSQSLVLNRLNTDGRIDLSNVYDGEDLDRAMDDLDQLYVEGEGAAHAATIGILDALRKARAQSDLGAQFDVVSDEVIFRDHRLLGTPDGNVKGVMLQAQPAELGESSVRMDIRNYYRLTDNGSVAYYTERSLGPGGELIERLSIFMHIVQGGLVRRIEAFDVDDADKAIESFDSITGGQNSGPFTSG